MQTTIIVRLGEEGNESDKVPFESQVATVKEHLDRMHAKGIFGKPAEVKLRYLIVPKVKVEERPVQEHGTPTFD